jgi:hypothetical protein
MLDSASSGAHELFVEDGGGDNVGVSGCSIVDVTCLLCWSMSLVCCAVV